MKFICFLKAREGKIEELLEKIREVRRSTKREIAPDITEALGLFGDHDAMIIFEAVGEVEGAHFVFQFQELAETETLLAVPLEQLLHLEGG